MLQSLSASKIVSTKIGDRVLKCWFPLRLNDFGRSAEMRYYVYVCIYEIQIIIN